MRHLGMIGFFLCSYLANSRAHAHGNLTCGLQPLPDIGCHIGRCVDGAWQQVCNSAPTLTCGIRPIPDVGCRVGRCVDGAWEQVCN